MKFTPVIHTYEDIKAIKATNMLSVLKRKQVLDTLRKSEEAQKVVWRITF